MKSTFEYVMSAPLFGIFPNRVLSKLDQKPLVKEVLNAYTWKLAKEVSKVKNYDPLVSVLYNGFTETNQIRNFEYYELKKINNIYADSGGLQIVTRGMSVTDELKQQIYKDQTFADYAMCFDVISLSIMLKGKKGKTPLELKTTKNERAMADNKRFSRDDHKEAAIATGKNIKEQIESFKRQEAKTKVIVIVQGNNKEDMLMFYNEIERQLNVDDYNYIGGFAVADTCIGNGQIESVEMLRAAKAISDKAHPAIGKHFHLLGIGSILRMVPVVFLKKSGYLDKIDHISYDSSTHTSSFSFGTARLNGSSIKLSSHRNKISCDHFSTLYDMFSFFLKTKITKDNFMKIIFGDKKFSFGDGNEWSIADINARAAETKDDNIIALGYAMKTAHTFYQVNNFCHCIDGLFDGTFPLGGGYQNTYKLMEQSDEAGVEEWLRHQKQSKKSRSKRIRCKEDDIMIDGAFI